MSIKKSAAAIAALTLLAGAPAVALAYPSGSDGPIAISNAQVYPSMLDSGGPGDVTVSFQNTSGKTATDVVFEVVDPSGNVIESYDDAGTFSPGVTINQDFVNDTDSVGLVRIAAVRFDDGSAWGS